MAHDCQVSDFGLSRTVPINTFLQTATLGTVTHMPPELLEDGLLGPSADVYSFGIMLWEMISGGFPFQAMGQHDIVVSVVRGVRPPMPTFVTTTLWALIQQCWDGDHQKRPSFISIVGVLQSMTSEIVLYSLVFLDKTCMCLHCKSNSDMELNLYCVIVVINIWYIQYFILCCHVSSKNLSLFAVPCFPSDVG